MGEWREETWCVHAMESYSAFKEILAYVTPWMNLEQIMLRQRVRGS